MAATTWRRGEARSLHRDRRRRRYRPWPPVSKLENLCRRTAGDDSDRSGLSTERSGKHCRAAYRGSLGGHEVDAPAARATGNLRKSLYGDLRSGEEMAVERFETRGAA